MRGDFLLDPIVATFARYGLRKASMEDVAAALGVSRQALYLRHGSKGALIGWATQGLIDRSEEHTSELQSLMRISYAVFCLTKKTPKNKEASINNKGTRTRNVIIEHVMTHITK